MKRRYVTFNNRPRFLNFAIPVLRYSVGLEADAVLVDSLGYSLEHGVGSAVDIDAVADVPRNAVGALLHDNAVAPYILNLRNTTLRAASCSKETAGQKSRKGGKP